MSSTFMLQSRVLYSGPFFEKVDGVTFELHGDVMHYIGRTLTKIKFSQYSF
jgi:hypothetical protein